MNNNDRFPYWTSRNLLSLLNLSGYSRIDLINVSIEDQIINIPLRNNLYHRKNKKTLNNNKSDLLFVEANNRPNLIAPLNIVPTY